ncbi:hypothetical protein D3C81_1079010 [compost metagenome]
MRSAKAPTISAVVMPAKVDWNATNRKSGRPAIGVLPTESGVKPLRKANCVNEPKNWLPALKTAL